MADNKHLLTHEILTILYNEYMEDKTATDISECTKINAFASELANVIVEGLDKRGVRLSGGIHPNFRSCSKCQLFHESPHHEDCKTCNEFSNFKSAERICSRCGSNLAITTKVVKL